MEAEESWLSWVTVYTCMCIAVCPLEGLLYTYQGWVTWLPVAKVTVILLLFQ